MIGVLEDINDSKGYYPVANHDTQLGDWLSLGSKTDYEILLRNREVST